MVLIAVGAVIIAVCSWITIPSVVPFTLQTFAIFLVTSLLGGKKGSASVLLYILLGAVGVPVFSGFRGGLGHLLGTTGGYIVGFLFSSLFLWTIEAYTKRHLLAKALGMTGALAICYLFGTVWFYLVYQMKTGTIGISTILMWCVIPFIIPDMIKMILALLLERTLRKIMLKAHYSLG